MEKKCANIFLFLLVAGTFSLIVLAANADAAEYTHDLYQNTYWGKETAWSGGSIAGNSDTANISESIILGCSTFPARHRGGTLNNYGTYDLKSDINMLVSGYGETTHNLTELGSLGLARSGRKNTQNLTRVSCNL